MSLHFNWHCDDAHPFQVGRSGRRRTSAEVPLSPDSIIGGALIPLICRHQRIQTTKYRDAIRINCCNQTPSLPSFDSTLGRRLWRRPNVESILGLVRVYTGITSGLVMWACMDNYDKPPQCESLMCGNTTVTAERRVHCVRTAGHICTQKAPRWSQR